MGFSRAILGVLAALSTTETATIAPAESARHVACPPDLATRARRAADDLLTSLPRPSSAEAAALDHHVEAAES
jgi:hypothetical protein